MVESCSMHGMDQKCIQNCTHKKGEEEPCG
jgi:hypothetical protein